MQWEAIYIYYIIATIDLFLEVIVDTKIFINLKFNPTWVRHAESVRESERVNYCVKDP